MINHSQWKLTALLAQTDVVIYSIGSVFSMAIKLAKQGEILMTDLTLWFKVTETFKKKSLTLGYS